MEDEPKYHDAIKSLVTQTKVVAQLTQAIRDQNEKTKIASKMLQELLVLLKENEDGKKGKHARPRDDSGGRASDPPE